MNKYISISVDKELNILSRILFTDLSPADTAAWAPDQFRVKLTELTPVQLFYPARWEHVCERPLTAAHKYYARLIDSSCNRYYNHAVSEFQQAVSREEKEYQANSILRQTLSRLLYDLSGTIQTLKATEPGADYGLNPGYEKPDSAYIYGYMRAAVTGLYMNIQEQYREFLNDELLTEDELLRLYFKDGKDKSSLLRLRDEKLQPLLPATQKADHKSPATVSNSEVYSVIEKLLVKEKIFHQVILRLKEFGVIDQNLIYIPSKTNGNARKLAVVCLLMVNRKSFFRNSHPDLERRQYKDADILKLLYSLFNHDLRSTAKKISPEIIETTRIKLPWLDEHFPVK